MYKAWKSYSDRTGRNENKLLGAKLGPGFPPSEHSFPHHESTNVALTTRRSIFRLLAVPAAHLIAKQADPQQGMSSRHVKPVPRGNKSGLPFNAHFIDIAEIAGLREISVCGHPKRVDYVIEAMGCGAAFLDYDNDGWLDVLVLSASRFGDPPTDASNRLYKNNRDGTFTDVTHRSGLFHTGYSYGVTVGDYNNDGYEDIFITGWPRNALYRNNGDGTFTNVTKDAGLLSPEPRFGSGCTFLDFDRDGKLDLFLSNYVTFTDKSAPRDGDRFIGPRGLPYGHHSLYRNNGDGTFSDVTAASGIGKPAGGFGLTAVAAQAGAGPNRPPLLESLRIFVLALAISRMTVAALGLAAPAYEESEKVQAGYTAALNGMKGIIPTGLNLELTEMPKRDLPTADSPDWFIADYQAVFLKYYGVQTEAVFK